MCDYLTKSEVFGTSHHIQKTDFLLSELKRAYKFGARIFILFGSQWNKLDTMSIVALADSLNMEIILIETRLSEAKEWEYFKSNNKIVVLQYDADHFVDENLLYFVSLNKNVVIYDNLSGGRNRVSYWEKIFEHNLTMLLIYAGKRGIAISEAKKLGNTIECVLSPTASILSISKYNTPSVIENGDYKRNPNYKKGVIINSFKNGCHCPSCGYDCGYLNFRKDKTWHCSKCWEKCNEENIHRPNGETYKSSREQLLFRKKRRKLIGIIRKNETKETINYLRNHPEELNNYVISNNIQL